MKRFIYIVALLMLTFAVDSCQKDIAQNEDVSGEASVMLKATALGQPVTKASYYEENGSKDFCGKWERGDVIFGFKDDGTGFDFKVESVDSETGTATLLQIGSTTFKVGDKLHAVYFPGKTSADIAGGKLTADFSRQSCEEPLRTLLLCDAIVTEGPSVEFSFSNAVSVVGLVAPVLQGTISEGKSVVRVVLSGHEIVSSGEVSLVGDKLTFTGNAPSDFIVKTVKNPVTAQGSANTVEEPIYVVIPAGKISKLSVAVNNGKLFEYAIDKTAEMGKYYRIADRTLTEMVLPVSTKVEAGGVEWSKNNLGADVNGSGGAGNLYRWSDTGIIYEKVTSSTVTGDATHPAGFIDYLGEIYCSSVGEGKINSTYTKYNEPGLVLDPVDDIVQLTYPGSGWRMPTVDEFTALAALKDNPAYMMEVLGAKLKYSLAADKDKNVVLRGDQPCSIGGTGAKTNQGIYWTSSSTNNSEKPFAAQYFQVIISNREATGGTKTSIKKRCLGYSIRPVKPVSQQ